MKMSYFDSRANLAGKVAVVVGGGEGMGRGYVLGLLENGVDVYMCDYNDEAMAITAEMAKAYPNKLVCKHADVCNREELKAFWDEFENHFDHLEILINNAGGTWHTDFLEGELSTPEFWDNELRRNLTYVIESTYEAGKRMKKGGKGGSIINLITSEAYRAAPGFDVYSAAKGGNLNWIRNMAVTLGPYGIRVNGIAPDCTTTPGGASATGPYYDPAPAGLSWEEDSDKIGALYAEQAKSRIPLGRYGTVDEIVSLALFLASDLASYITGVTVNCDGGVHAASGWLYFPEEGYRNGVPVRLIDKWDEILGNWPEETTGNKHFGE